MGVYGVMVGADQQYAWLLPWWWKHYSAHNTYPVTFVNFGVSDEVLAWCRARGDVLNVAEKVCFEFSRERVDVDLAKDWEMRYGTEVWDIRKCFLYKPVAFQHSSYDTTLWLDVDCEVCGQLQPFFELFKQEAQMALSAFPDRPGSYSSGAVVFDSHSPLVHHWVDSCIAHQEHIFQEDSVLSWLINTRNYPIQILPESYHLIGLACFHTSGLVRHWSGIVGKLLIETHGGYQEYKQAVLDQQQQ